MRASQGEWHVEVHKLSFSNSDEESLTFTRLHKNVPYVIATPSDLQEGGTEGQGNVNLFVSQLGLNSCKINSSSKFTGTVHVKVISVIS